MKLYYQRYPVDSDPSNGEEDSRPPAIIIPGLFGSTTNWRSIAKHIGENYPVWVIDLRNHGRSPHASSHTYAEMCKDLLAFMDQHGLSQIIPCGHSMGGKVAMLFSLLYPERVSRLAVLDMAPVAYQHNPAPFLEALLDVDLRTSKSRNEADRVLQTVIPDTAIRLFLLQNLSGSAGNYQWRINLPVLHQYMSDIAGFPKELVANHAFSREAVFIYGELSDYVQDSYQAEIAKLFTNAEFASINGAGHWLHADQPDAVVSCLLKFLIMS